MVKNKKIENYQTNSKAEGIISNLINLSGVTIGIIILSIGAVTLFQSFFKLYIFDIKKDTYGSSYYKCEIFNIDTVRANEIMGRKVPFDLDMRVEVKNKNIKNLTKEDKDFLRNKYQECVKESKKEDMDNFQRGQKTNIAEGLAFILVGIPLIYFYQRRRRSKK